MTYNVFGGTLSLTQSVSPAWGCTDNLPYNLCQIIYAKQIVFLALGSAPSASSAPPDCVYDNK